MTDPVDRLRLNNADDIAVLLEEHLRIEEGHIAGKTYVAVKIAEEYEAEIRRISAIGELFRLDRDGLRDEARELRAENERMRKALEEILEADRSRAKFEHYGVCGQIARAALASLSPWIERLGTNPGAEPTKEPPPDWGGVKGSEPKNCWNPRAWLHGKK